MIVKRTLFPTIAGVAFAFAGGYVWADAPADPAAPAPVETGYLGVHLAPVPEALAAHQKEPGGVLVEDVSPGSPAASAGLKRFDIINSIDGTAVKSPEEVGGRIRAAKPGTKVTLGVVRGSEKSDIPVTLGTLPTDLPQLGEQPREEKPPARPEAAKKGFLGVKPDEVPGFLAYHLGLKEGAGVLVTDVVKGSSAEKAGLHEGDVVTAVAGHFVEGPAAFLKAMAGRKVGDEVKLDVIQKGEKKTLTASLAERPKGLRDAPRTLRNWPQSQKRGQIRFFGPNGTEHSFQLPEDLSFKTDELMKDLEDKFGELRDNKFPGLRHSLEETMRDIEQRLQQVGPPPRHGQGLNQESSNVSSSVVRQSDGEWDITIRSQDGRKTVTVVHKGETVATDVPWEKLGSLPADAQERVKKAEEALKTAPSPALPEPSTGDETDKVRA